MIAEEGADAIEIIAEWGWCSFWGLPKDTPLGIVLSAFSTASDEITVRSKRAKLRAMPPVRIGAGIGVCFQWSFEEDPSLLLRDVAFNRPMQVYLVAMDIDTDEEQTRLAVYHLSPENMRINEWNEMWLKMIPLKKTAKLGDANVKVSIRMQMASTTEHICPFDCQETIPQTELKIHLRDLCAHRGADLTILNPILHRQQRLGENLDRQLTHLNKREESLRQDLQKVRDELIRRSVKLKTKEKTLLSQDDVEKGPEEPKPDEEEAKAKNEPDQPTAGAVDEVPTLTLKNLFVPDGTVAHEEKTEGDENIDFVAHSEEALAAARKVAYGGVGITGAAGQSLHQHNGRVSSLLVWDHAGILSDCSCAGDPMPEGMEDTSALLLSAGTDGVVRVWARINSYKQAPYCVGAACEYSKAITSISVGGNWCISGAEDGSMSICDLTITGSKFRNRKMEGHTASIGASCILGNIAYSSSGDQTIKLWDIRERKYEHSIDIENQLRGVGIAAEGIWLYSLCEDKSSGEQSLQAIDIRKLGSESALIKSHLKICDEAAVASRVLFSCTDGGILSTSAGPKGTVMYSPITNRASAASVKQWLISNKHPEKVSVEHDLFNRAIFGGAVGCIKSIAHNIVICGCDDGLIRIIDVTQIPLIVDDDSQLAYADEPQLAVEKVFPLPVLPGTILKVLSGHSSRITALASLRGRVFSASDDQTLRAWNIINSKTKSDNE